jgi:hypothetical protein
VTGALFRFVLEKPAQLAPRQPQGVRETDLAATP